MIKVNFKKILKDSPQYVKDIFFPRYCAGCGIEGTLLCASCKNNMSSAIEFCAICRKICKDGYTHKQCSINNPLFPERITSVFTYSGAAKDIILSMKFQKESRYANLLSTFCIEKIHRDKELSEYIQSATLL